MINLVKYRFLFILVSLIIIIPGTIALMVFGLKVGLDFAGGSNIVLRPQTPIQTTTEVHQLVAPLQLEDLQVVLGDNPTIKAPDTIWIRLNTWVDTDVRTDIENKLKAKYPSVSVQSVDLPTPDGKKYTQITATKFGDVPPTVADIQALLVNLPNTTDLNKTTLVPGSTPTPQPTAVNNSAAPTPTPTATPTPAANPNAIIPVKVDEVLQGKTTQVVTLLIGVGSKIQSKDIDAIQAEILKNKGPHVQVISSAEVGPSVAGDTTRNSIFAILAASAFILFYIWFAFRKIDKAWRYGTCAIIALLHDVLVVLGIFSILGWLFNIQVDALFITALLTVIGFSVHDTIVVFDRIRENMRHRSVETFEEIVNASLVQTMARSLNTSLTVLFTLLALTLFGSSTSVHTFTLTLLIGIASGTYSSIFNASMLLVVWEKGEMGFGLLNRDRHDNFSGKRKHDTPELASTR